MRNLTPEYLAQCRDALNVEQAKSLSETNNWSHVNKQQIHVDWDALYKNLVPMLDGSQPSSPAIQEIVAQHYAIASRFYIPSRKAYIGMGLFYNDNKDMKDFHNAYHPNMAEFMGEAIYVYAQRNL
jgi:hypothetical protein